MYQPREIFPFKTCLVNYPYFVRLWVVILAYERLYTKRFALGEEIKRLWKEEGAGGEKNIEQGRNLAEKCAHSGGREDGKDESGGASPLSSPGV